MQGDLHIHSILATQEYYDENRELVESRNIAKLYVADKKLMQSIVGHKIHHNCMAHGERPQQNSLDSLNDTVLMLDSITSTENVGSIARSMAALGVSSYLLPTTSPHPYSRRSLRVSMGYMSMLKYHIYEDIFSTIERLKQLGYKVYAAELTQDSTPLLNFVGTQKWVLIMGHEGKGIRSEVLALCDEVISIEMQEGIKSFNVGVAASLIMYKLCNPALKV